MSVRQLVLPERIGVTEILEFAKAHNCEAVVLRDNHFAIIDPSEPGEKVAHICEQTKPEKGRGRWFKGKA